MSTYFVTLYKIKLHLVHKKDRKNLPIEVAL